MMQKQILVLCGAAFFGGIVGGVLSTSVPVYQDRLKRRNLMEYMPRSSYCWMQKARARAGLGLDANGEIGLVLRSKDGSRTLTLSPDEPSVIKLVERGGRILWEAP